MRPAAAFAAGLWTGAVVVAAIGVFYFRVGDMTRRETASPATDKLESRLQLLQQEQARAQAEAARLKQTIAELQTRMAIQQRRQEREALRREIAEAEPVAEDWIVDAVVRNDPLALPRLERAALQSNVFALDALALLAEHDNGEALARVWRSGRLTLAARQRATLLLAATAELNPNAGLLLQSIFTNPPDDPLLRDQALIGILLPDFKTPLQRGPDFPVPPRFRPDYAYRLRLVEGWRATVTNEALLAAIDSVREKLAAQ